MQTHIFSHCMIECSLICRLWLKSFDYRKHNSISSKEERNELDVFITHLYFLLN